MRIFTPIAAAAVPFTCATLCLAVAVLVDGGWETLLGVHLTYLRTTSRQWPIFIGIYFHIFLRSLKAPWGHINRDPNSGLIVFRAGRAPL